MTGIRVWLTLVIAVSMGPLLSRPCGAQGREVTLTAAQRKLEEANRLVKSGKPKRADGLYREAIALDPNLEDAYEWYSMSKFAQRQYKDGERIARDGLKHIQGSIALKAQLGLHLVQQRKFNEAHKYLKTTAARLKTRFEVQAVAGQCCLHVGDYECAELALRNYLSSRPSRLKKRDNDFRFLLGLTLLKKGDVRQAETILNKVLLVNPDSVPAQVAKAEVFLRTGKCAQAVSAYERLFRRHPRQKVAALRLLSSESYLCVRRYREALREAELFLREEPSNVKGLLLKGDALTRLRRFDRALAVYKKAAALSGGSPEVRRRIAEVCFDQRRYSEVLEQLREELARPDAHLDSLVLGIRAAIRAKKLTTALELAGRLAKEKGTVRNYYYAGMAHSSASQFEEALVHYEKARALSVTHQGVSREMVRALCHIARRHYQQAEYAKAIEYLDRALVLGKSSVVVNRNFAVVLFRQGRNREALQRLEIVLRKVPNDFLANRLMGRILFQMGKYNEAQTAFDQAVGTVLAFKGPALARALVESGACYLAAGKVDQAIVRLERALELARRPSPLADEAGGNVARAYVRKARKSMKQGNNQEAWAELQRALGASTALPPKERAVVQIAVALGALTVGNVEKGRSLLRGSKHLSSALRPPYAQLGVKLLLTYADYLAPSPQLKLKAAQQFEKLGARLPVDARARLLKLAQSAQEQAGALFFRAGKTRLAQRTLAKASRLPSGGKSPRWRHNMAVVDYEAGAKAAALATLDTVKGSVPAALCNLAIHFNKMREMDKSLDLFRQCERRKVPYPGLREIIKAQSRVVGPR